MERLNFIITIVLILICTSCIGKFEQFNTDPTGYSEELQKIDYNYYGLPLTNVQQGIYFNYDWGAGKNWTFQTMQNLSADMFAGYFHNYKPFLGGLSNTVYNLNESWNSTMWEYTYWYIVPQVKEAEERNIIENPEFYGIARILKVALLHRLSDVYGPIIYENFGTEKIGGTPDSQRKAYYHFFDDLETGINILKEHIDSEKFVKFDLLMPEGKKNYRQWIKFANSLRLRLAIRISKVEPEKAREEAEKSLILMNEGFFLEDAEDIVAVSTANTGYTNPLGEVNRAWGEVIMNANMESILTGYEDPRLSRYFEKATDKNISGTYKGIRQGTGFNHEKYQYHSRSTVNQTTNAVLMTAAEVWFLRAEAALRGWSNESPKACYEKGVKESFARWRISNVDEYLVSERVAADYVGTYNPEYNIEARCLVTPKWEETASNEIKLEKIITQKWIACYPEGCEAWAEQRRTGYPRLFPVKVNMSNGTIDTEIMIRRLSFPSSIRTSSADDYQTLLNMLGGADTGGTRLWWDTGGPNF